MDYDKMIIASTIKIQSIKNSASLLTKSIFLPSSLAIQFSVMVFFHLFFFLGQNISLVCHQKHYTTNE